PPDMVWIIVDDDLVCIPQPAVAEGDVGSGYVPGPSIEPEARRDAPADAPNGAGTNPAGEPPMHERLGYLVASIIAAGIVAHPGPAVVHVGRIRVACFIAVTAIRLHGVWVALDGCRSTHRWRRRCGAVLRLGL